MVGVWVTHYVYENSQTDFKKIRVCTCVCVCLCVYSLVMWEGWLSPVLGVM